MCIACCRGFAGIVSLAHVLDTDTRHHIVLGATALTGIAAFALLRAELTVRSRRPTHQADELRNLTAALRESEARFRDFALTASDWFWETDREHRFTYTSDSIRAFGQDPDARLGRTRIELATDAETEQEKWREHLNVLNRHEPFRDFIYTRRLGGEPEHILSVSGRPVFGSSGEFLGYRGTARDVTEKVQAERRLDEARRAAEAANIAKAQFLANISHELRTPLNAILGFAEMIGSAARGSLPAEYQEYGHLIHQSGNHLLAIINDVLALSKIDAGKFNLDEEPVDPHILAVDTVTFMREHAQASGVELSIAVSTPIPNFRGDPRLLRQALLNLISNAIKFTEPGGQVVVRLEGAAGRDLLFEVSDTGIGMTASELDTAMQLFGQVEASFNRRYQGTGLGLPIARSLIELHGGLLQIESEKDRGTTARIVLPASRVLASPRSF